jgi:DNA-binding HxlR family transcriptional regulator
MARSYRQFCSIARALDVVGDRWALLVVRELLLGPKRYSDLIDRLPGIGSNILSQRLKDLEEGGVAERRQLPPPTPVTVYELTDAGRGLRQVVEALGRWGLGLWDAPRPDDTVRPAWLLGLIAAHARPRPRAGGRAETVEVRVGGEVHHLEVSGGRLWAYDGPAIRPAGVIALETDTLFRLATGQLALADAARSVVRIEGDPAAARRVLAAIRGSVAPPR